MKRYGKLNIKVKRHITETAWFLNKKKFNITFITLRYELSFLLQNWWWWISRHIKTIECKLLIHIYSMLSDIRFENRNIIHDIIYTSYSIYYVNDPWLELLSQLSNGCTKQYNIWEHYEHCVWPHVRSKPGNGILSAIQ